MDLNQDVQWPDLREKQRRALEEIPYSGMAVTMDLGEDNDLHPHGKMEIGRRLALLAAHDLYGNEAECTGPVPVRAEVTDEGVRISLAHAEGLKRSSGCRACGRGWKRISGKSIRGGKCFGRGRKSGQREKRGKRGLSYFLLLLDEGKACRGALRIP